MDLQIQKQLGNPEQVTFQFAVFNSGGVFLKLFH